MARAESSLGGPTPKKPSRSCGQLRYRDSPYTLVSPGLVELWLHLARKEWAWPVEAGETESGAKVFVFRSVGRAPADVATAECSTERQCTMHTMAGLSESSDSEGRDADELEGYAPPPMR